MTERTREQQLLLKCATPRLSASLKEGIGALVSLPIDWSLLIDLSVAHAVLPTVAAHLTVATGVPPAFRERLDRWLIENTARNLSRTTQLAAVMRLFQDQGIDAVAWKGPSLAATAYGHVGLRHFDDLDVLVDRAVIRNVVHVMRTRGYSLCASTARAFSGPVPATGREYRFLPADPALAPIEVQASGAPWPFAVRLDARDALRHAVQIDISGASIRTLGPEDAFLHAAIHGASHCWSQLRLVSDVDATASMPIDWTVTLQRAKAARIDRMVAVAVLLAETLLDTAVPDAVRAEARRDRTARQLSAGFAARLFTPVPSWLRHTWRDWSSWRQREHASDRVRYVTRLIVFDLFVKQWDWVRQAVGRTVTAPD